MPHLLPLPLLVDAEVMSIFWRLQRVLQWTWMYSYLFGIYTHRLNRTHVAWRAASVLTAAAAVCTSNACAQEFTCPHILANICYHLGFLWYFLWVLFTFPQWVVVPSIFLRFLGHLSVFCGERSLWVLETRQGRLWMETGRERSLSLESSEASCWHINNVGVWSQHRNTVSFWQMLCVNTAANKHEAWVFMTWGMVYSTSRWSMETSNFVQSDGDLSMVVQLLGNHPRILSGFLSNPLKIKPQTLSGW